MKVLFAHPADVAHADQVAATLVRATVRLRGVVPPGRMYVIAAEHAAAMRYGFELEQCAEQVIDVDPSRPFGREASS
jgi:hypothetical protein